MNLEVLIVGGGPAGLRAAEVAREGGARVVICEGQSSVGRKFLVAGRGGLNLTHGEPAENFPARYQTEPERWRSLLAEFSPDDLRAWAAGLTIETYVGTSGRVFPRGQKAAELLRAWTKRLRSSGVDIRSGLLLRGLTRVGDGWQADFSDVSAQKLSLGAGAIVLALGGTSWPETGSDGTWPAILATHGVTVAPWVAANCGWEVAWPNEFKERAEGLPLKNLTVTCGTEAVSGELLITRYGLEGGAIYRLGPALRAMAQPRIVLNLKPQLSPEAIALRLTNESRAEAWPRALKLSPAAAALMETYFPEERPDRQRFAERVQNFPLNLLGPRPIAEAISSAGGIAWSELDENLMLTKMPGVFAAGEMIDWEAPTGGYLLQGCFSTGTRAGRAAAVRNQGTVGAGASEAG